MMGDIPVLYDPYRGNTEFSQAAQGMLSIYGPVAQQKALYEQEHQQGQESSGIDMHRLFEMGHTAVANGADPTETAYRIHAYANGDIPHPTAGLPPDHPFAQAAAGPGMQPAGAPPAGPSPGGPPQAARPPAPQGQQSGQQVAPPAPARPQPPQGAPGVAPEIPGAPGAPQLGMRPAAPPPQIPPGVDSSIAGAPGAPQLGMQPMTPGSSPAPSAPPAPAPAATAPAPQPVAPQAGNQGAPGMVPMEPQQGSRFLTNAERDFILKGGLRAMGVETPLERMNRALALQALRNEGATVRVKTAGSEARTTEDTKEGNREKLETEKQTNRATNITTKETGANDRNAATNKTLRQNNIDTNQTRRDIADAKNTLETTLKKGAGVKDGELGSIDAELKTHLQTIAKLAAAAAAPGSAGLKPDQQKDLDYARQRAGYLQTRKDQRIEELRRGKAPGSGAGGSTETTTKTSTSTPRVGAVAPPGGKAGGAMSAMRRVTLKDGRTGWLDADNNFEADK